MTLAKGAEIYFIGIGGTGMASVAGLCQEAGYRVKGSDAGVYPPMSDMLAGLGIPVKTPYNAANLQGEKPDLVVVANVLSRGNVELEHALAAGLPYTSFPKLLGDLFLSRTASVVVSGTHGKTTTTSLLAHVLTELGEDPGFLIGGIPRNLTRSFQLGGGRVFAIEGDEYDTAFFDKGPKFLHYHPRYLILNNLEFDHADIYPNVEAIEAQFKKLVQLVKDPRKILANVDDPGIVRVLGQLGLIDKVCRVATLGREPRADVAVLGGEGHASPDGGQLWRARVTTPRGAIAIETSLSGRHNLANIGQVIATVLSLEAGGELQKPVSLPALAAAIASFAAPKRRLDLLAKAGDILVYEDFAHHPTAVRLVIEGFRTAYPDRRLVVAFEPRSASNRRNVFQKDYARSLALADRVLIGECLLDQRIPEENRFNAQTLAKDLGAKASALASNQELVETLKSELRAGDAVIFMSSGSFSGAQHQVAAWALAKHGGAPRA